ncbi:MAG: hypothetical protein JNK23_18220 [Opitutaceae bacterium]|nr:hypothetical protein [Opitutaceae bacterium]
MPTQPARVQPPARVRKQLATLSLLVAWLCANGGLLDGVQVVAWARMFAGYAQTMPVAEALRTTFDPEKPCAMCLGVAAAKGASRQQLPVETERAAEKLILACQAETIFVIPQPPGRWPAALASAAPRRVEKVPVPPPRA